MRKISPLPSFFVIVPLSVGLLSCSSDSNSKVTSVRSVPYYEVYNSQGVMTSSGHGTPPYRGARTAGNYTGGAFAGKPKYQYPLVGSGAPKRLAVTERQPTVRTVTAPSYSSRNSPSHLLAEVKVRKDFISTSARGRRDARSMRPRYITIHSTQNWSQGADAWRHSLALKNSKLGKLSWHYTVDENVAVQHLPTNITGNHADYDGPGNRYSIGIEMCEHPGNSRRVTVNRTAKLAAYLMYKYDIPLAKVVPHYHWPRYGKHPANKNCPHYLLDNGRPGSKWRGFQSQVKRHFDDIAKGGSVYVSR